MTKPAVSDLRGARREAILDLLSERPVRSQAELGSLLAAAGHDANQATLSRDLRDLGVVKGPSGYVLPANGGAAADAHARLRLAARQWLSEAVAAQNQVVLRTPPGGAQPLAFAIDHVDVEGVVGTLAGDDTILVVAPDSRAARKLVRLFESYRA